MRRILLCGGCNIYGMNGHVIDTRWNGYRFRSRLEARWAVFLDHVGALWQYEREGYHLPNGANYLPDFWLANVGLRSTKHPGIWMEIKPEPPTEEETDKARLLGEVTGHPVVVMFGLPGRDIDGEWGYQIHPGWDNYMQFCKCYRCNAMKVEFCEGNYMSCESCDSADNWVPGRHQRLDSEHPLIISGCEAARSARFGT